MKDAETAVNAVLALFIAGGETVYLYQYRLYNFVSVSIFYNTFKKPLPPMVSLFRSLYGMPGLAPRMDVLS